MKRLSIAAVGLMVIAAWGQAAAQKQAQRAKPRVRVTISKETTYITEPLREDGYVDYLAALNQRCQKGVTPENNAAVLLLKAMGPGQIDVKDHDRYCRMLGIESLPENDNYFVPLLKYTETLDEVEQRRAEFDEENSFVLFERLEEAGQRVWSQVEFPALAGWLAVNEKPLSMVIEASKRPRRYDPLIVNDVVLLADSSLTVCQYKRAAEALAARAMLRLGEGKASETWEDLLACHRLARLVGQGPTSLDLINAMRMNNSTCAADQLLLQRVQLSTREIAKMRDDLVRLPPMQKMTDKIDVAERYMDLDCAAAIPRMGPGWALRRNYNLERNKGWFETTFETWCQFVIEVDVVLRIENACYDRLADACRKPTRAERVAAIDRLEEHFRKLGTTARNHTISEWLGYQIVNQLWADTRAGLEWEDSTTMVTELNQLAFALAAYRADQGSYPAKLAELIPKYVAKVSDDVFSAAELHYRRDGDGYLLYSVGPNGKDDGARGLEDCTEKREGWDDVVVRMTAGKKGE